MIIKTLVENSALSGDFKSEHGLSLYIETKSHKILFDMGETGCYLENAKKLGADIADIDLAVISHGHSDHGGGLKLFLENNKKAPVYIHPNAFHKYYSRRPDSLEYIGLDEALKDSKRLIHTDERFIIDEGIEVFYNIKGRDFLPTANRSLLMQNGEDLIYDTFLHEQNLVITEDGKTALFAGCAHNGIVNIVSHFYNVKNRHADYVIGGFHLFNPVLKKCEAPALVREIAGRLNDTPSKYYTCHCTGSDSYNLLKEAMGDKIGYLAAGRIITI